MKWISLSLVVFVAFTACQNVPQQETSKGKEPTPTEWKAKMHELSQVVARLIPLSFSSKAFHDPKNKAEIEQMITRLEGLAHGVEGQADQPGVEDPSLQLIAKEFEDEIQLAKRAFKDGQTEFSRFIIRDTLSYCIECHTHKPQGAQFMSLDLGTQIDQLSLLARGEFYAATRQFDRALETFMMVLSDAALSPMEWEKTSLNALAITVRYLRSPEKATQVVDLILENPDTPYYMRRDATAWKKAVKDWQKEWPGEQKLQGQDLLTKAKRLVTQARDRGGNAADATTAIENLRASALLHMYLSEEKKPEQEAEALLYLGQAYQGVRQFNISSIEDRFYEACIRKAPHTDTAQSCYRRYRENILVGYSGSAGLMLPAEVQLRIKELQTLAAPKDAKK